MKFYFILLIIFITGCSKNVNEEYHYVQINGKEKFVRTLGEGSPVVVFINGGGSTLKDFVQVQNEIAKITKTISYDKFGLGKSELIDSPRTLENVASELKVLLQKEKIDGLPIVLVGHSMGGGVARYFLHKYPDNVAGSVLIDPGSEYLDEELRKVQSEEEIRKEDSILAVQIELIPEGFQREVEAYPLHDSTLMSIPFKTDIPITLLESNQVDENDSSQIKLVEIQKRLYRDLTKDVPQLKIISTEQSGHFIQLDEPELVIAAIEEMIEGLSL